MKSVSLIFLLILLSVCSHPALSQSVVDGLVAHWTF